MKPFFLLIVYTTMEMIEMKTESIVQYISFAILCIALLVYVVEIGIQMAYPSENKMTFEIIGINNSMNTTSIADLHFECIKYCSYHEEDYNPKKMCYEQCAMLGKEVC